jgi:hypothetical protein
MYGRFRIWTYKYAVPGVYMHFIALVFLILVLLWNGQYYDHVLLLKLALEILGENVTKKLP